MDKFSYIKIMGLHKDLISDGIGDDFRYEEKHEAWFCCTCDSNWRSNSVDPGDDHDHGVKQLQWNLISNSSVSAFRTEEAENTDKSKENDGDNLSTSLRVPLLFGALMGLIPIRGLNWPGIRCRRRRCAKPKFTFLHYRTLITILLTVGLFLHTIFITHNFITKMLYSKNSAGTLILTFSGVWFYSAGTLVFVFFLTRSRSLCRYFEIWARTSAQISTCMLPDKNVRRDVNLITAFVLIDCLGENILYHFHAMKGKQRDKLGSLSFSEFLQDYYNSNEYIFPFFNFHAVLSLALLITNKLATFAWNFGDIILILISRALYGQYMALNKYLESQMESDGCILMIRKGAVSWTSIRKNYLLITGLLQEANRIFSPLIWLSYTTDIFFVCRQLYQGLAPGPSQKQGVDKIYVVWSLLHLIFRTIGVNMMATFISEEAHRISKILQHVHPNDYDEDVRRLERFLGSRIIGITGSGCFVITRSFVLMIISAIFTLEVVLLQNANLTVG